MNLGLGLLWIGILCIILLVCFVNWYGVVALIRAFAVWVGNKIADWLGGSPRW